MFTFSKWSPKQGRQTFKRSEGVVGWGSDGKDKVDFENVVPQLVGRVQVAVEALGNVSLSETQDQLDSIRLSPPVEAGRQLLWGASKPLLVIQFQCCGNIALC